MLVLTCRLSKLLPCHIRMTDPLPTSTDRSEFDQPQGKNEGFISLDKNNDRHPIAIIVAYLLACGNGRLQPCREAQLEGKWHHSSGRSTASHPSGSLLCGAQLMTKSLTRGAVGSSPRSPARLAGDYPISRSSGSAYAKRRASRSARGYTVKSIGQRVSILNV